MRREGTVEKIERLRKEVEEREDTVSGLKDKLDMVTNRVLSKKKDLDEATAGLAEAKQKKAALALSISQREAELGGEVARLTGVVEQMDREKVKKAEELEKRKEVRQDQEQELQRLIEDKGKKMVETSNMEATVFKMEGNCKLVRGELEVVMMEVDRLGKMVGEEDKVEKDLEMLREDLRVCEENRKLVEGEVVTMRRVQQQKVGLEKENMNMKSRAEMLEEKEESYREDLDMCRRHMDEMAVKEVELINQWKELEDEDLKFDEEIAALTTAASQAMEEANVTEVGNKELERKIEDIIKRNQNEAKLVENLEKEEVEILKNLKSAEDEAARLQTAVATAEVEGVKKADETKVVQKEEEAVKNRLARLETGLAKKMEEVKANKNNLDSLEVEETRMKRELELKRKEYKTIGMESEEKKVTGEKTAVVSFDEFMAVSSVDSC